MSMYDYEEKYAHLKRIGGTDEAGRGCWAGPLVVGTCILPKGYRNDEINDSKQLSEKKREELYDVIIKDALAYSIQLLTSEEVDKYNPKRASIIGMERGIEEIKPDITLIDAERINPKYKQESIIKGDSKSITIAAASILAKVYRDRYMRELDKKFPQYNFAKNKGYGTKDHMIALEKYGIINEHRKSYKPIKKYCD